MNASMPYSSPKDALIVLSGWAIPAQCITDTFRRTESVYGLTVSDPGILMFELNQLLYEKGITTYSLIAFSLGALCLSQQSMHLNIQPSDAICVGVRPSYEQNQIDFLKQQLNTDKEQTLKQFYRQCFAKKSQFDHFIAENQDSFDLKDLEKGLDYLANYTFNFDVTSFPIHYVHGALDRVAPNSELQSIIGDKLTRVEKSGHFIFYDTLMA